MQKDGEQNIPVVKENVEDPLHEAGEFLYRRGFIVKWVMENFQNHSNRETLEKLGEGLIHGKIHACPMESGDPEKPSLDGDLEEREGTYQ